MFKVMIIDDEWLVREGLKTTIAWHEMQCEIVGEADNGIDALKLIDELSPDILLSDIRMPGMDGLELVQTISRRDSEITTIFLTGFDDFSYAQQAVKLGAFDILLKPSDPHELRKTFGEATRMITLRRQQMDYTKILEKHQRTSQPFVLEKVLQHLLTDTASMQDMQLLYEALEGFLEPFEAFRVAVVDFGGGDADALKEPGWESGAAAYFRSCALTDPIPMNSGVYAVLLSEVGGSRWREGIPQRESGWHGGPTISLSRVHHGLLALGKAYDEACIARLHHVFLKSPTVISYENLSNDAVSSEVWDESEVVEAIKWGSEDKLKEALQALYKALLWRSGGKEADPKQFRVQLVFGVYNLLTLHFHETGGLPELKGVLEKINELRSSELMLDWLESMAREVRTRYLESKSPSRNEIDAVLDYIHDHFTEELMMYDLAASLHMSESKFSKLFKKQAGKSFMDYITELRINKAKELLLDPEVRIGEIALMVGYQETRYFSQLFKKTTGMTQKSFRRKLEKLKNNKEK